MSGDRDRCVLARIINTPELARVVPRLQPELLHAAIAHYGLAECGELLSLATPEQLSAVFDLDLWKAPRVGADEQFDDARFCEWLEVLVDAGGPDAAAHLATLDPALVVAGLSPNIRVFDSAVFSPLAEPSGADPLVNEGRERGVHAEIGSYLVVARRTEAWDAIVDVLVALEAVHPQTFERVMRTCCRLSNSGWELDGLDDLLSDGEQARFDLSVSREQRRDRLGFLPPKQARAFLDEARRLPLAADTDIKTLAEALVPPAVFIAHQRAFAGTSDPGGADVEPAPAVASVIEVLHGGGILADPPRLRLSSAQDEPSPVNSALNGFLQRSAESSDTWTLRQQECAFLANALAVGCSVQGRSFTRREAVDAVAATCNLGLEHWPQRQPPPTEHGLVTIFQVGWSVLHREVSMAAAAQLLGTLDQIRTSDRDLQRELYLLTRELRTQRRAGTPWRARGRLEVLATLDLPAWAALVALLDECPVMLVNVSAGRSRDRHTVDPSAFQFIADREHLAAVERFLLSLPELLSGAP